MISRYAEELEEGFGGRGVTALTHSRDRRCASRDRTCAILRAERRTSGPAYPSPQLLGVLAF